METDRNSLKSRKCIPTVASQWQDNAIVLANGPFLAIMEEQVQFLTGKGKYFNKLDDSVMQENIPLLL